MPCSQTGRLNLAKLWTKLWEPRLVTTWVRRRRTLWISAHMPVLAWTWLEEQWRHHRLAVTDAEPSTQAHPNKLNTLVKHCVCKESTISGQVLQLFPTSLSSSFWKFWSCCFRRLKGISEAQVQMPPFQNSLRNWIFTPLYIKYNLIYKVWSVTKHSQKWTPPKCTTCLNVFEYWKRRL